MTAVSDQIKAHFTFFCRTNPPKISIFSPKRNGFHRVALDYKSAQYSYTSKPYPLRVGLFGIGLEAYWPQFEGLKPKLEGYLSQVADKIDRSGAKICNLSLSDYIDSFT